MIAVAGMEGARPSVVAGLVGAPFVARDKKRQGGRVGWVLPRLGGVVLEVAIGTDEAAAVYARLSSLPPQGPFNTLF